MYENISIDVDKLRHDLEEDGLGGFFVGGFGEGLMESIDIKKMSVKELVKLAQKKGIDLRKYKVD